MKIAALYISPGHNFFGRHGKPAGEHVTESVEAIECVAGRGIRGDRFFDYKRDYAGQITFFDEAVHRAVLQALRPPPCPAASYRRNVITRGIDLNSLIGREFVLQGQRFLGMSESKPCHWMEQAVGAGAENFLRGRGGLRARILTDGRLNVDCATEAGLLLAGGRSRRMGRDKANLTLEGRTFAEHQAATLAASGAWPLLFSCRADQTDCPPGFLRVEDADLNGGVLGALVTAWSKTKADVLTVLAIDTPRATPELLARMAGMAREEGVSVVPLHQGHFEPLVAAWHRSAVPALGLAATESNSLQDVCARLQAAGGLKVVDLDEREAQQLANINTPADFARLA